MPALRIPRRTFWLVATAEGVLFYPASGDMDEAATAVEEGEAFVNNLTYGAWRVRGYGVPLPVADAGGAQTVGDQEDFLVPWAVFQSEAQARELAGRIPLPAGFPRSARGGK